ncbi:MAG: hypothetical protein GXO23_05745 [Crenarchaeota archaeon]|nr:hypothetical protein [Thermoproteota archaeon]
MSLLVTLDRARNILKKWIKERNLIIEELESDHLILREGDNTVLVKIIVFEDLPDIDEINREITVLASRRSEYNKMYIAVSRDVAHLLDGKLLKKLGIGVIAIDLEEGEAREILQSPAISRRVAEIDVSRLEQDLSRIVRRILDSELSVLRREIEELKNRAQDSASGDVLKKLEKIREEIESIWNVIDRLKIEIERLKNTISTGEVQSTATSSRQEAQQQSDTSPVPDFIKDNPWVQILANKNVR